MKGYLALVLHGHIPYVITHGVWPHGADWLNECCAETYIPLLDVCNQLVAEGISPKITIGLTPILCEQLRDASFSASFVDYLDQKVKAAVLDADQFRREGESQLARVADRWRDFYLGVKAAFCDRYRRDLIGAFKELQDAGHIEIITCAATHAYLPLLSEDFSVKAQIAVGKASYTRVFGREPTGIWLPECAYRPGYNWKPQIDEFAEQAARPREGIERFVGESRIDYFIVDAHLLRGGKPIGTYLARFDALRRLWEQVQKEYTPRPCKEELSPYRAHWVGSSWTTGTRVAFFTRDPKTGLQVWSGEWGYPGTAVYLDFHKKRFPGGLRYWKVTDPKADLADKAPYRPELVETMVVEQSGHFLKLVGEALEQFASEAKTPGIVCAPFDAELFGHWWFEGPHWIYHLIKAVHASENVSMITCGEYLKRFPPEIVVDLPEGSWGEGGFHYIWLNQDTRWTWRHIYRAEAKMKAILERLANDHDPTLRRIINQAARELMLLQSSDWQFLITTWCARDYAEERFAEHDRNFSRLAEMAERYAKRRELNAAESNFLKRCELQDAIFPEMEMGFWTR